MPDRRQQIIQLLGSRYDGLYLPAGALRTPSGLAPGKRVLCPACGHTEHPGWHTDAFKRRTPCRTCGGQAEPSGRGGEWLNRDRGKGFVYVDSMDALQVPVGSAETAASARPRRTVTCDACAGDGARYGQRCDYCDGTGRRDQHLFELTYTRPEEGSPVDPMTEAIERRDQAGSYHELEAALAGIVHHVNKPARYHWLTVNATTTTRLLDEVYLAGHRDEHQLSVAERALVDLALAYIDSRMPDPIRVPVAVRANGRELERHRERVKGTRGLAAKARDEQIKTAIRRGQPTQRVAFEYGLSVSQVNRIVGGEAA